MSPETPPRGNSPDGQTAAQAVGQTTGYADLAREILAACGGPANVGDVTHCATRLRLVLRDPGMADRDRLSLCSGLAGIIGRGNGLHLVFGAEVVYIYREFMKALPAR